MVSRGKVGNSQHFPTNLHILLDEAEKADHTHIVSWCSQGQAFKIHDQDALVPLLAKYFRQTKFKSFLRQLQSYDFHRITRGSDKGTVSHPLFVRGRRSLCFRMTRKPTGATSAVSQSVIPPSTMSSANLLYSQAAIPSNDIVPIRKSHSSPIFNKGSQSGIQWNQGFAELSHMKNATFELQGQPIQHLDSNRQGRMNSFIPKTTSSGSIVRGSAGSSFVSSPPACSNNVGTMRRTSAPIAMSFQERGTILECSEIDYSLNSNSCKDIRGSPPELPSGCIGTQQVSFQQQALRKIHPGQNRAQEIEVQRTNGLHNQVILQHVQYQQGCESQHHRQHKLEQQGEVKAEQAAVHQMTFQWGTNPKIESVHSERDIASQINELRRNLTKQLEHERREQRHTSVRLQKPIQYNYPCEKIKVQYQQQKVDCDGMKHQEGPKRQAFGQLGQTHIMYPHIHVDGSMRISHHEEQGNSCCTTQSTNTDSIQNPLAHHGSLSSKSLKSPDSNAYPIPSCDLDISFSASEFKISCERKNDDQISPSFEIPSSLQPIDRSTTPGSTSFSGGSSTQVAVNTIGPSSILANTSSAQNDCSYRTVLQVTTTNSFDSPQRVHSSAPISFSLQNQQATIIDKPRSEHDQCSPLETTSSANIETGTVDYLLQNGGGCDEWDIFPEDLAEVDTHLGAAHITEGDDCTSMYSTHHRHNNVAVTPVMSSSCW